MWGRECCKVYYRRYLRNAGTEGWCSLNCYIRDYRWNRPFQVGRLGSVVRSLGV